MNCLSSTSFYGLVMLSVGILVVDIDTTSGVVITVAIFVAITVLMTVFD